MVLVVVGVAAVVGAVAVAAEDVGVGGMVDTGFVVHVHIDNLEWMKVYEGGCPNS